ncbi:GspH/FimT family pseudopilin [Pseudomonadota bacterium]
MKNSNGFTLVEVIITLVVVSILIAVGVPGLNSIMANSQATAHTNDLVTALSFSRNESVKRGTLVAVCAKSSKTPGNLTCGGGGNDWLNGWFAFVDSNGNATADDGEDQLRSWPAPSGNSTMTAPISISFDSAGTLQGGGPAALTITYSHCTGQQNRDISITTTGHTSIVKKPCT